MIVGKKNRLKRIMNFLTGKTVIVPMDHGTTVGPIDGLKDVGKTVSMVHLGGANAVILHKGMVMSGSIGQNTDIGLIVHMSASTALNPVQNDKACVCEVEEALTLGADAVSVHVNIGAETESAMLAFLGRASSACHRWGLPLLAMMYPRGREVTVNVETVKLAARVGAELGADIIKCPYTGSPESFAEVVAGCPVPVVIAGGSKRSDKETLEMIQGAMAAGAAGLSMGRNAFQHAHPGAFIRAAGAVVHHGISTDQALWMIAGSSKLDAPNPEEAMEAYV